MQSCPHTGWTDIFIKSWILKMPATEMTEGRLVFLDLHPALRADKLTYRIWA